MIVGFGIGYAPLRRVIPRAATLALTVLASSLSATTLQRLSLEEMARQATEVVRGRVTDCQAQRRTLPGALPMVYTDCRVRILETWKGAPLTERIVSSPGGVWGQTRQSFSGVPSLRLGEEYVFFLWTGRSGVTQVIGLSQGLLMVERVAGQQPMAVREPIREPFLDAAGRAVRDEGIDLPLDELRKLVAREGRP